MVWAPEDFFGKHLPLALLTGFLGSGKTSLLNQLLRDPRMADTAIAINEFGDIGLDQHFVEAGDDDVILLANGCMCCLAGDQIEQSLARIFQRSADGEIPAFKRLVIETSGMADPEFVLQSILDSQIMSRFLWLDSIVTTVDSLFGVQQIGQHHEAAKQVRLADRLVITKADMVDAERLAQVRDALADINPAARQIVKANDDVDISLLFSPAFFDGGEKGSLLGAWAEKQLLHRGEGSHAHAEGEPCNHGCDDGSPHVAHASTFTLTADSPVDWHRFTLWLGEQQRKYGDRLLRVKGLLNVRGTDDPVVVHAVQSVMHVPVSLKKWPDEDRRTRIVFILNGEDEGLSGDWTDFLARSSTPVL
ncbi:MAG: GTP-binding protein [Sphingobium sp.]